MLFGMRMIIRRAICTKIMMLLIPLLSGDPFIVFIVRSVPDPFMSTLDCADPSQSVPVRNENHYGTASLVCSEQSLHGSPS